jgi:catechol 2,3-dioxygenase-like lactoylglutathione lyase family enzyme
MFAYVHHVGMIVPNIDEAMDLFQNKLRLKLLRRETVASSNINWRSSLPERLT